MTRIAINVGTEEELEGGVIGEFKLLFTKRINLDIHDYLTAGPQWTLFDEHELKRIRQCLTSKT